MKSDSRSASARVRRAIDQALREHGDLGVYGDLSAGLEALEADFVVTIHAKVFGWYVDAYPHSGEGHDFGFNVNRVTGKISDVVVGELAAEPEEDEDWE
jgi:hypothetical protein